MPQVRSDVWVRLESRMCLSCGHDGPELQREGDEAVFVCTNCGQDLYSRPPMSYAQMEGLVRGPDWASGRGIGPEAAHASGRAGLPKRMPFNRLRWILARLAARVVRMRR